MSCNRRGVPGLGQIGQSARELVRQNFLITRHLREYLTLEGALTHGNEDRIELG